MKDEPPPAFLRARKPQPEPTPEDNFGAWMTAIYFGIAVMVILFALALLANP